MRTVAIIPARAGSKRVPKKNKRLLHGKPLILYTILQAKKSKLIKDIVITSDDDQILQIASNYDCVGINRPKYLSKDNSQTIDVVLHALKYLEKLKLFYDAVLLLQPTIPFRQEGIIDKSLKLLSRGDCDSVISHILVDYFHPNRMKKIIKGFVHPYCENEIYNLPRKYLPKAFYRDGSIYASTINSLKHNRNFIGKKSRAIITDPSLFLNIDTEKDWKIAEIFFNQK